MNNNEQERIRMFPTREIHTLYNVYYYLYSCE